MKLMYLIIIPLLYAETLLVGLRSHFLILDSFPLTYFRPSCKRLFGSSKCKFYHRKVLPDTVLFYSLYFFHPVLEPFGIALSLKCCPPPQRIIIMYGWGNWARTSRMQESKSCALPIWRYPNIASLWKSYHGREAHIHLYTAPRHFYQIRRRRRAGTMAIRAVSGPGVRTWTTITRL